MFLNFAHKNVLITGGSRGIGRACARLFADLNANVIITYKTNKVEAEKTLSLLKPSDQHSAYQLNVADAAAVERFAEDVLLQYNRLDVLVNNAGVFLEHRIEDVSYHEWQQAWTDTINTNLIGVSNLCFLFGRQMIRQGGGKIVNVSSRGAFRGEPDHPAYGASKAGLNALSQSLALALGRHKITVGIVAPGFVDTDMAAGYLQSETGEALRKQSPLNRVATAEEVANAIAVFASEGFEFMTGGIVDLNGASYLRS